MMSRRQVVIAGLAGLVTGIFSKQIYEQISKIPRNSQCADLIQIENSLANLDTIVELQLEGKKEIERSSATGVIYDRYILSAYHITGKSDPKVLNSEIRFQDFPLAYAGFDDKKDIVVFYLPSDYEGSRFPFGLGDSNDLHYGQKIFIVGTPEREGVKIREGVISSFVDRKGIFTISAPVVSGDSGSPVVDASSYNLLGIVSEAWYNNTMGAVRPINFYKPFLK